MGLIYLALYKGKGRLFNRLIRLWTRSRYSHCEIVMPDGRWLSASAMDGGVRAKYIELNLAHWDLIPLPWANTNRIAHLFRQHAGKGYDWAGIFFSQLLASGLHSRRRMFCSEFCAAALGFDTSAQRFSPAMLGEVAHRINRLPFVQLAHSLPDRHEVRTPHG
ncbi:hypothetical protein N878_01175 [Pseudomonas sp. EGD-AK9]|uniref:hypothetical protein n=1 Tax=Pseudomonas sp. EGD-AK9 TaxID=1386078 RepID=UPI000398444F|nr:hypothetical protein [Pseudomonas sp. EGD-AK9]ERI52170.1 hypothetical protein N878_01175 [Pseudomonas sp. EGD-AK9]